MRPTKDLSHPRRPPQRPALILGTLLLLLAAPLPAAETLADAWRQALAADARLRASTAESDAAQANLAAARGLALPKATASSTYTVLSREPAARIGLPNLPGISLPDQMPLSERTYATHALQASLPVYTGGRIAAAIAAADAGLRASQQERLRTEQVVKLEVAEAWLNVLRARQADAAARSHLAALEAHAADVTQLAGQGLAARSDVLSVAVARADALQRVTQAGHAVTLAGAAYNRLLGRPFESAVELTEPPPPEGARPALEPLVAEARQRRPEMALLGTHAEATDREADLERAGARPQVALSGALLHEDNRYRVNQDLAQVTIGVQWEIFDGGVRTARVDAAAARARAVRDRQADAASLIELEVHREWLAVEDASQRLDTARAARAQADENLRVARDRYRNGVGTHTEVLDAEALRSLSDSNHLNAHYDLHLARYRLRKAVGDL
ncbi:MAG: TolC family protein [Proteobacteria bacterium]|nr:TolC family protein [Pseudomonadota bacterium]